MLQHGGSLPTFPAMRRMDEGSRHRRGPALRTLAAGLALLGGCVPIQSAMHPAGRGAERIADIVWLSVIAGGVISAVMIGLWLFALHRRPPVTGPRRAALLILGAGAVVPSVVLGAYLAWGLAALPELLEPAPPGSLRITVSGERWWWRVRYQPEGRPPVPLANELRLPVGAPVELLLESPDVIHSFWAPPLGGKIDMIPGRQNRLTLWPERTGVFRGACAEYCGEAHAFMNFYVVVQEPEDHARWLEAQARPAPPPSGPLATRGHEVFFESGCGACHAVRGTPADGTVGPDLTHVGSRLSLGAGLLPNEPEDFVRWIASTGHVKPGVLMPAFGMLPPEDLRALAAYLDGLE